MRRPAATAGAIVAPPGAGITGAGGSEERYSRGELLGQGTLGDVFRGFDTVLQRTVIIKDVRHVYDLVTYVPREEISRRVRSAALAQAKLLHPHVLRVVDLTGESIIVDDATGGSLRSRMARGPLPVDFVVRVVLQASYALHFAHKNDVVHGSIKPENVLFDAFGNVKLADFGVARVAERSADGPQTSAPPVYVGRGSPSYMAPEQLHQSQVGKPADVYALGILLYELLTGTLPGRRSPMPSSQARVVEALGKDGAAKIDDLFDKMTRDPLKERFADFDEVLKALVPALPKSEPARGTLYLYEVDPLPPPASPAGPSDDMIIPVTGSSVIISSVENTGS